MIFYGRKYRFSALQSFPGCSDMEDPKTLTSHSRLGCFGRWAKRDMCKNGVSLTTFLLINVFLWMNNRLHLQTSNNITELCEIFFSQCCVRCAINIHWTTTHFLQGAYSVFTLFNMHPHRGWCVNECTLPLYFIHIEQTDFFILQSSYAVYHIFFFLAYGKCGNWQTEWLSLITWTEL